MASRWQGICLWAAVLVSFVPLCRAQSTVAPEDEYKKLIRVSEDIQPLGENPFGEQVSLYNGSLSFEQTDVSLAGNGPLLQLSRSFHPLDKREAGAVDGGFADWDMEIPRITTLAATQWLVAGTSPRARCSRFGLPPTIAGKQGGADWEPATWWAGYQLVVPGQGSQDLLRRSAQNTLSPTMGSSVFGIVTTHHWVITCGVATDDPVNDPGGEGFLAVAPDGTRYWFTHLVYRWAPTMERPIGTGPLSLRSAGIQPLVALDDRLIRRQASMLVTRIEDRFGNSLTYSYSGNRLVAITASDGRRLDVGYVTSPDRVSTLSVTPASGPARTWSYQYSTALMPLLSKVTLPDGSAWSYDLAGFRTGEIRIGEGTCDSLGLLSTNVPSGSMVHPSGLRGTFRVAPVARGRSYVPRQCMRNPDDSSYALVPRSYAGFAITQKTFSGAGLPTYNWIYRYSPANASWGQDCAGGCVDTVWTDVVDPEGHATRHTFGNRFDETEGQLQRTDNYSGAVGSSLLSSEVDMYAASGTGPWPSVYGDNLQSRMNWAVVGRQMPLNQRVLTQDGDTYTWQAEAFNEFVRVTQTRRSSSAGSTVKREQTTYLNDLPHWVLGLPLQVTNITDAANPEIESANTYDLTKVTLKERWRFGQKLMSYTFNSAGQLASFTDGNSHTTTLGSYKRGIPQAIGYPDGTSQHLVVDDFGQIASITDQAGHTTGYGYDAVGRLTGITYPTGDEQAWLPQSFSYNYVTGAERGLGANHWRRTVSHGNARTVTYFDALLRPVLSDRYINGVAGSNTTTLTTYDAQGRTTFASYPNATALNFTAAPATAGIKGSASSYDALGRPTQVRQDSELGVLTTTTAYLSGARRQVTDPKGNATTTSYQVFDQPSYDAVIQVQAPAGVNQSIARNLYGEPLSIRQYGSSGGYSGDVTRTLIYDGYHRLCRSSELESDSTVLAYDGANNLAWSATGLAITGTGCGQEQVAAGAKTTRTYDAMNRVKTLLPPAGTQSTSYGYDAVGRLTAASSGISAWSATYNKRGQPTGETLALTGQPAKALAYAHDTYGSLSQLTYPNGEAVAYAPDALGRPTRVGNYLSGIGYFPNGEIAQASLGNGALYVAEQNARQLLRNFSYGKGSTLNLSEDLSYDKNGNITQITDLAGGPRGKTLGYDALDRLTSATAPSLWGTETYAYDPLHNLRSRINGSQATTYNYDSRNRLASLTGAGATSFIYDPRGNVVGKGSVTLGFDAKNQLLSLPGISYAYDAAGRRVMKAVGSTITYSFYNQAGQLLHQWEPATGKATNLILLGRKPIARSVRVGTGTATVTYSYADAQGTPLAEANASGTVTATFDYRPYGSQALGTAPNGIGYTGHVNDPESGFVYMQQRYYDPGVGRFLSVDPVTAYEKPMTSFNRYAYARNNPYRFTDPDGRDSVDEMIDSGAEGCGPVSCAGWALLKGTWGAIGAEGVSQWYDKGWSSMGGGDQIGAGLEIAAVLPPFKVLKGANLLAKEGMAAKGAANAFKDFNQARNAAVGWLDGRGFKAEQTTLGKFGDNAGRPIGMRSADGKSGFRVEFDERHGAHINVWSGKQKETFTFEGNQSMVNRIIKHFVKERP